MRWDDFWIFLGGGDDPYAAGIGFGLFTKAHLIWLGVILAGILAYTLTYCFCGERVRDNMRKGLAVFLIFFEIFKQCVLSFKGAPDGMFLPLEICSLAEYTILIDALWPGSRLTKQLLAFGFLPAAFMALMMPTAAAYPAVSFFAIHQMVMHGLIVAYIVAGLAADEIRPVYIGLWASVVTLGILILPVYYVNYHFGKNYMYLMDPEKTPPMQQIYDVLGGNGGLLYVIGLVVLVAVVMHIMFGIYVFLDRFKGVK